MYAESEVVYQSFVTEGRAIQHNHKDDLPVAIRRCRARCRLLFTPKDGTFIRVVAHRSMHKRHHLLNVNIAKYLDVVTIYQCLHQMSEFCCLTGT